MLLTVQPTIATAKHKPSTDTTFYDVDSRTFVEVEQFAFAQVLHRLKNPRGADFVGEAIIKQVGSGAGRYAVGGFVDCTNGFGAVVRTQYRMIIVGSGSNLRVTECVFTQ